MTKPKTAATLTDRKDAWMGGLQLKAGSSEPLTDQQLAFVETYVGNGGDAKAAAKAVGYDDPVAAAKQALADPRVREQVELKRDVEIKTAGATKAWQVIEQLMTDPSAPAQVKFQAAKWTLEASGHGLSAVAASLQLGLRKTNKPLSEMSVTELEEFVTRGRQTFDTMKGTVGQVLKAHANTIDVTPKADT
jgi:hypothetical protein